MRRILASLLFGVSLTQFIGAQSVAPIPEVEQARAALEAAEASGDSASIAEAARVLGLEHWRADQFSRALPPLIRARDLFAQLGDSVQLARTLNTLGAAYYQRGIYEPALEAFLLSREIRANSADVGGEALALTNVGKTYHDWRQYDRAAQALAEAVRLAERSGDQQWLGYALHSLGMVELDRQNYADARRLFGRSSAAYQTLSGTDSSTGWSINTLSMARLDLREGRYDSALRGITQVLEVARQGGTLRGEAHALLRLGEARRMMGDPAAAVQHLRGALALTQQIAQRPMTLEVLAELALAEEARGNLQAALSRLRQHAVLRDSVFDQQTAQRIAGMELEMEADRTREVNTALRSAQRTRDAIIERQRLIVGLVVALLALAGALLGTLVYYNRAGRSRETLLAETNKALERTNAELQAALSEVRTLSGFIPICANCKRVRDDEGYWQAVESYLSKHSDASFSHSICTACGPVLYGDSWDGQGTSAEPDAPGSSAGTGS